MTFPTGGPGGYPGQPQQQPGYGQPLQGPGYGAPTYVGGGFKLGMVEILASVVALLGLVTLFVGFAPVQPSSSAPDVQIPGGGTVPGASSVSVGFYESGFGWIPAIIAIAGLIALLIVLPGKKDTKWGGLLLAVNVGAVLPVLFTFWSGGDLGGGAIMIMIFAILQLLVALAVYLLESEIIKLPAKSGYPYGQPGYGQPGGYGQQYGQQPGGFGGQPGQQQFGPPGGFGGQPGGFGGQPGQQGGHPGTPPGGFGGGQQG